MQDPDLAADTQAHARAARDNHTFALADASGFFVLEVGSGDGADSTVAVLKLSSSASLDFEQREVYPITVTARDQGGLSTSASVFVFVGDVNDAPTPPTLSLNTLPENAAAPFVVGTLQATDQDRGQSLAFSIDSVVPEQLADAFAISGAASLVYATPNPAFALSHEVSPNITLTVSVRDSGGPGAGEEPKAASSVLTLRVTDANDAVQGLVFMNASGGIPENEPAGFVAGTLVAFDEDNGETVTFEIASGAQLFQIDPPGPVQCSPIAGAVRHMCMADVVTRAAFDFEAIQSITFLARATDSAGSSTTKFVTLPILDRNDAPHPELDGLLDDEIGARLLDRREEKPEVGRVALRRSLLLGPQQPAASARLRHRRAPFAVAPVEHAQAVPGGKPHHAEEIMRLRLAQTKGLPLPQRMLYIKPDLLNRHEASI